MTKLQIAAICHEANRALCEALGDHSQKSWDLAEEWQRQSALRGVEFALSNPGAPASGQHDAWLKDKQSAGWIWGPVKDPELKQHPCIMPYEQLPLEQQAKDRLFKGVVAALKGLL